MLLVSLAPIWVNAELMSLAKKERLDPNVFEHLVEQKAYTGDAAKNAFKVEEMYLQIVQ